MGDIVRSFLEFGSSSLRLELSLLEVVTSEVEELHGLLGLALLEAERRSVADDLTILVRTNLFLFCSSNCFAAFVPRNIVGRQLGRAGLLMISSLAFSWLSLRPEIRGSVE